MPGIGGSNGPIYQCIYINEYVCPEIRGINEVDIDIVLEPVLGSILSGVFKAGVLAAKTGASIGFSLVKGFGISMVVKGFISPISAYVSSDWELKPY